MSAAFDDIRTDNWRIRRPLVIATLVFCALQLAYLTIWGEDNGLTQTLAIGAYGLAGSTLGSYLFAATWDTKNLIIGRAPQPQYGQPPIYSQYGQPYPPTYGAPPFVDPANPAADRPA